MRYDGGCDEDILLCLKPNKRDHRPGYLEQGHEHPLDGIQGEEGHAGARLGKDCAGTFARPEHGEREHEDVREAGADAHGKAHEDGVGELVRLRELYGLVLEPLQQVVEAHAHGLLDDGAEQDGEPGVVFERAYGVP